MPEGPFGGPRPAAKAEVVVYSRFRIGGDVHSEETEPLQLESRFREGLIDRVEDLTGNDPDVRFHPAGFIVGVEVFTNTSNIPRDNIDRIVEESEFYLESVLDEDAKLEPSSRRESAVEVRAK